MEKEQNEFNFGSLVIFEQAVIEAQNAANLAQEEIKKREAQIEQLRRENEYLIGQVNFHNGSARTAQAFAERALGEAGLTVQDYLNWKKSQAAQEGKADATTSELVQ